MIALLLTIGVVMWIQRNDAAQENIDKYHAGADEWEKNLATTGNATKFGMSGT